MLDLKKLDKKIELGDIFFIDAGSIYSFGVSKEDDMIGDRYGTVSSKYSDMLFAVKYIGNAVVEEMLTGEKILLCGEGDRYRKDFHTLHKDFEQVDFGKYYSVPLSVEKALVKVRGNSIAMHIDNLNKILRKATEYPLTHLEYCGQYEITEEAKKWYLKYNSDARRKFILNLRKQADEDVQNLSRTVGEIISQYGINDINLEMAYLENDIYNFQKKKI